MYIDADRAYSLGFRAAWLDPDAGNPFAAPTDLFIGWFRGNADGWYVLAERTRAGLLGQVH